MDAKYLPAQRSSIVMDQSIYKSPLPVVVERGFCSCILPPILHLFKKTDKTSYIFIFHFTRHYNSMLSSYVLAVFATITTSLAAPLEKRADFAAPPGGRLHSFFHAKNPTDSHR